jgi:hypothetical protein
MPLFGGRLHVFFMDGSSIVIQPKPNQDNNQNEEPNHKQKNYRAKSIPKKPIGTKF